MKIIIDYILNMLPYMLIAIPFYLIVRVIILKKRNCKINWYHEAALFIFVIFIAGLASQTVIPKFEFDISGNLSIVKDRIHETNLIPFRVLPETYREVFELGNISYFITNFLGNIVIFMPIGFFVPLLWNKSDKAVVLTGFCCTFFIEFCQLFLRRGTDVDDLILNTLGVTLGLLVYKLLCRLFKSFVIKFRDKNSD